MTTMTLRNLPANACALLHASPDSWLLICCDGLRAMLGRRLLELGESKRALLYKMTTMTLRNLPANACALLRTKAHLSVLLENRPHLLESLRSRSWRQGLDATFRAIINRRGRKIHVLSMHEPTPTEPNDSFYQDMDLPPPPIDDGSKRGVESLAPASTPERFQKMKLIMTWTVLE
jgi:plasmid stability protein